MGQSNREVAAPVSVVLGVVVLPILILQAVGKAPVLRIFPATPHGQPTLLIRSLITPIFLNEVLKLFAQRLNVILDHRGVISHHFIDKYCISD